MRQRVGKSKHSGGITEHANLDKGMISIMMDSASLVCVLMLIKSISTFEGFYLGKQSLAKMLDELSTGVWSFKSQLFPLTAGIILGKVLYTFFYPE